MCNFRKIEFWEGDLMNRYGCVYILIFYIKRKGMITMADKGVQNPSPETYNPRV